MRDLLLRDDVLIGNAINLTRNLAPPIVGKEFLRDDHKECLRRKQTR